MFRFPKRTRRSPPFEVEALGWASFRSAVSTLASSALKLC
ncbi:hypothetical protein [Cohnella sp.]